MYAITIDDGPTDMTPSMLAALAASAINASFFLIGQNMQRYPETVNAYSRQGHSTFLHSFRHESLTNLSPPEVGVTRRRSAQRRPFAPRLLHCHGLVMRLRGSGSAASMLPVCVCGRWEPAVTRPFVTHSSTRFAKLVPTRIPADCGRLHARAPGAAIDTRMS